MRYTSEMLDEMAEAFTTCECDDCFTAYAETMEAFIAEDAFLDTYWESQYE